MDGVGGGVGETVTDPLIGCAVVSFLPVDGGGVGETVTDPLIGCAVVSFLIG